jgi:predicted metal-dependent phosphoesterase TrpH
MNALLKLDLHTHSEASYDGGIQPAQYRAALESGVVDCVAITDHNRIDAALQLHNELGDRVIVGEEIMSAEGEIIGLYLTRPVSPGLSARDTMRAIKDQAGLVYVPHPFETIRRGLHPQVLDDLSDWVDLVEVCNGRAFLQQRGAQVVVWAKLNGLPGVASSDAHGRHGLGRTYTCVSELPDADSLVELVRRGTLITDRPRWRGLLYPKYHRLRKRVRRKA